jgi:cytochrome c oxidase subunit 2
MPIFDDPASAQAVAMRTDWLVFLFCGIGVGAYVYISMTIALVRWREQRGRDPARYSHNYPLEITYAAIPIALVTVLFFAVSDPSEQRVDAVRQHPGLVIDVTAYQWSFRFFYPSQHVQIAGASGSPPTLVLPEGVVTEIDLRSADVTHSFWIPAMLFKRDAIPGMVNRFDLTPTRTGTFRGLCAQYCGIGHTDMTFKALVVPKSDFRRVLLEEAAS